MHDARGVVHTRILFMASPDVLEPLRLLPGHGARFMAFSPCIHRFFESAP